MKSLILILSLSLLSFAVQANESTLVLEGIYQNKNIFVSNGFHSSGVGFCASQVKVNGDVTTDEVGSSAFEITLEALNLQPGEKITIEIVHSDDCTPKIINPGDVQPTPSFTIVDMTINDGKLTWETEGELGSLPYIVEQFKWNKWVKVGEVQGQGTPGKHDYSFNVPLISGKNKFRVVQRNLSGTVKASNHVELTTNIDQPEFSYNKKNDMIEFSVKTGYEIYDVYGQIRKRGASESVDLSNLSSGVYYLNYDNAMVKFKK